MKNSKYLKRDGLYYSALYGNGVYKAEDVMVRDPLCSEAARKSPLLENIFTGERIFFRRISFDTQSEWHDFVERILDPPDQDTILWPIDLLELAPEQAAGSGVVDHVYDPGGTPLEDGKGGMVAAFQYAGPHPVMDGFEKLAEIGRKSWKSSAIQDIAVQIAGTINALNQNGLIYNDFHLSRFFFLDGNKLYLDYSNMAQSHRALARRDTYPANGTRYPIEFADPAVIQGVVPCADKQSQDYSLCALFFYLFFGQYAYDGRLMTGYADDTVENHYIKFRDYHKMPIFIFDPADTSNSLGVFGEEEDTIALWEDAPGELRNMFIRTLREGSALRTGSMYRPGAAEWLQCFHDLRWC